MSLIHCFFVNHCISSAVTGGMTTGYPHHLISIGELAEKENMGGHLVFINSSDIYELDTFTLNRFNIVLVSSGKEADLVSLLERRYVVDVIPNSVDLCHLNLLCLKYSVKQDVVASKSVLEEDSSVIFKNFMKQFPGLAFIKDTAGRFIFANEKFLDILGVEPTDLIGKTVFDIQPQELSEACTQHEKLALFQQYYKGEEKVALADGTMIDLMCHKFVVKLNSFENIIGGVGFDITEQLRTKKALEESQNRFQGYIENSPFSVIICCGEGRIDYVNTTALHMLDCNQEYIIGKHISDFNIISQRVDTWRNLKKDLESGNYHLEIKLKTKTGVEVQVELYAVRIELDSYLFQFNDISIRKEQELELGNYRMHLEDIVRDRTTELDEMNQELFETFALLADNNGFLESIIDNLPIGLEILDADLNSVKVNAMTIQIWGLKDQQVRGGNKPLWDDYRSNSSGLCEIIRKSASGEQQQNITLELFAKEGEWEYKKMLVTIFPIYTNEGEVRSIVLLYNDITELHKMQLDLYTSELKFRDYVENNPVGSLLTDEVGNILIWNKTIEELLSVSKSQILGQNISVLEKEKRALLLSDIAEEEIKHFYETGKGSFLEPIHEKQVKTIDGRWQDILIRCFKLESENGFSLGITLEDITIQKSAEREVVKALGKEKQLNDLKSAFVSMASHQFKTPLSTILSSTELLDMYVEKIPSEMRDKFTKHISRVAIQVVRLNEMISDFLTLGQIETGRTNVVCREFYLVELLHEIVKEHFNGRYPNQELVILITGVERKVMADMNLMRHILMNVLSNAYKYSTTNPSIHYQFRDESVDIKVHDDGIGIPQEDLSRIFDSFYRARNAETYKGSGLGLSIVKRFVDLHNGIISIESGEDIGTTVFISMPI